MAQMSSDILLSRTPSSVVRGELSYRDFRTRNGSVGREQAMGDVRMCPTNQNIILIQNVSYKSNHYLNSECDLQFKSLYY
jgi:hypothetical protein